MDSALAAFEAIASHAAGALLAGVAYALPVAIVAWATVRLLPQCNAATRYGIWLAALVATLALDPLPGHPFIAGDASISGGRVSSVHRPALTPSTADASTNVLSGGLGARAISALSGPNAAPLPSNKPIVTLNGDWAVAIFLAWYLVATALIIRLIVGHIRLQRIKDRAVPLGASYQMRLAEWLRASRGSRVPRLLVSGAVEIPVAIGLFHPAIVLPADLVEHLTESEFDQIGMHELAHVRRYDDWTNLLQKIAETLLFFSPAIFVIGRQLSIEREVACDDWVVSATGGARPYANCLTRLAELAAARPVTALPTLGAVFTQKQIFTRIERLLDRTRDTRPQVAASVAWAAVGGLMAVLIFASQLTPLVAVSATRIGLPVAASQKPPGGTHAALLAMRSGNDDSNVRVRAGSTAACPCVVQPRRRPAIARRGAVRSDIVVVPLASRVQQVAAIAFTDATPVTPVDTVKSELAVLANAPGEEERLAAVSALAPHTGDVKVREALLRALSSINDESVRLNIVAALAPYADSSDVLRVFGKILREGDDEPVALNIISAMTPAASRAAAMESLADVLNSTQDEAVGLNALAAVAPYAGHRPVQVALIGLMRNGRSEALRLNAVAALAPHANLTLVHRAFVDALDLDLAGAERANIKAALGIAPAATQVANSDSTWLTPEPSADKAAVPGKELLVGDVSATGTVRIDNVHGDIEVIGWGRASGEVDASVQGDPNAIRVYGTFEHGDLRVTSTQVDDKASVSVNYVVHVPAGAHVIVTTVSGNIIVRGVTGAVDATSTEGNVDVNGAHGPVSASTMSGNVHATGLRGDSKLKTISGDVQAEFDELDGAQAVEAESTAGTVTIVMPANSSAHITAETLTGAIHSCAGDHVNNDSPGSSVDKTTGAGTARVDLHAVSGDITISSH
ncbi:MAG TPA: M56 family metallopeptidase [Candidatus Eremiobacteraceae bacterium]